jgi:hypothetical protein
VVGADRAALEIENRPLAEFLTGWLANTAGRFSTATRLFNTARSIIRLHGSLDQLDMRAMLERVALVNGLSLAAREGVLWVGGVRTVISESGWLAILCVLASGVAQRSSSPRKMIPRR